MEPLFSTLGTTIGLALAIALVMLRMQPAYALMVGAVVGGLAGGGSLADTVTHAISGVQGMTPAILRILASGVLVGALIKTGTAERIARAIVDTLGRHFAVAAVAIATLVVCAVGVFIDISVITVAPVALAVARRANLSTAGILLAHNHPHGTALPSTDDIKTTMTVANALESMGSMLVDHLIFADNDFISLSDSGYIRKSGKKEP